MALHCDSMFIMARPPISVGSIVVFLFTQTFLYFQSKTCMSFLMFWIMSAGGFSTCPGCQILFSVAWLVFFPMGVVLMARFCISSRILFRAFSQFCSCFCVVLGPCSRSRGIWEWLQFSCELAQSLISVFQRSLNTFLIFT